MLLSFICGLIFLIVVLLFLSTINKKREGFGSYENCIDKGYTKEFCVMNPSMPGACLCNDGSIGRYLPGFKGQCVCGPGVWNGYFGNLR